MKACVKTEKNIDNYISLIAETSDDIFNLGRLHDKILGSKQGFTLSSKTSLYFDVDELVVALLKESEPCPTCS